MGFFSFIKTLFSCRPAVSDDCEPAPLTFLAGPEYSPDFVAGPEYLQDPRPVRTSSKVEVLAFSSRPPPPQKISSSLVRPALKPPTAADFARMMAPPPMPHDDKSSWTSFDQMRLEAYLKRNATTLPSTTIKLLEGEVIRLRRRCELPISDGYGLIPFETQAPFQASFDVPKRITHKTIHECKGHTTIRKYRG